jgi:protein TonB
MWIALAVAVVIHLGIMLLDFPEIKHAVAPRPSGNFIVVRKYVPPPPRIERQRAVAPEQRLTRRLPVPDPTPDAPEPIREPEPEILPPPLPPDVEFLIGIPEAPPAPAAKPAPLMAGTGNITNPVLIEESKVTPDYPELARVARVEGNVVLQAVIRADGSVDDLRVLRCLPEQFGFDLAAMDAVRLWHYKPALLDGQPVDVYFTVFVEFRLD